MYVQTKELQQSSAKTAERVIKMKKFYPENYLTDTEENKNALSSKASLKEAFYSGKILEARASLCDDKAFPLFLPLLTNMALFNLKFPLPA